MKMIDRSVLFIVALVWCSHMCGQRAFRFLALGDKGNPELLDEKRLLRYSIDSYRNDGMLRLFYLDTVPVSEMKERFWQSVGRREHVASPYAGKDSVEGPMIVGLLTESLLRNCPVKSARTMRGVWTMPGLRLTALYDAEGVEQPDLYRRVAKACGFKEGGRGCLPTWYDGIVLMLRAPKNYMGFVVSGEPWYFHYKEGRMLVSDYERSAVDFFSYCGGGGLDGLWADGIPVGMSLFANSINRDILPRESPSVSFTFLLHIRADYSCDIELLLSQGGADAVDKAFGELRKYIARLRPGLFKPLYTSDGRVLPGRYLHAWHDSRGWQIADLLATSPQIPEGEYRLQRVK